MLLPPSREADQLPFSRNEIVHLLLNLLKPHEMAAFTLEMVEQRCQAYELAIAAAVRAMI